MRPTESKRTRVACNLELAGERHVCQCSEPHVVQLWLNLTFEGLPRPLQLEQLGELAGNKSRGDFTCPVSLPIVKVICCWLAYAWNLRFCGVTLLSFFGLARVGEVLRCRRGDVLLPADLLEEEVNAVYLSFPTSKTASRELIFGGLPPEALLWPLSPAAYRYRWNLLLRWLGIPKGLALTPGGLRGVGPFTGTGVVQASERSSEL